ncbi:MAG: MBG domain-containing protein, partial [Opitutia bacterium]
VGDYAISISTGTLTATNYTVNLPANCTNGTLEVTKATRQVTATDVSRAYGAANPVFDYSVTGYKNSQTLATSGVTGAPTLTTAADALSPVGTYDITAALGTLAAGNYDFELIDGTLTITKALLTLKVDDATKVYGDDFTGFTLTMTGFQNGETQAGLRTAGALSGDAVYSYTNAQAKLLGVAASPHTVSVTGLGTLDADNYSFVLPTPPAGAGALTVTQALLSVTASDKTRFYGDPNPALEYTLSGFKLGETTLGDIGATGLPGLSTTAGPTTGVGSYDVLVDVAGLSSANYAFTGVNGTITIEKAPLTLKVDDKSTVYGDDFAGVTLTLTGFKNSETQAGLRTAGALSGDAVYTYTNAEVKLLNVSGSPYTVSATSLGTLLADNYSFSLPTPPAGTGQLTVTPAPVTLKASQIQRGYGDAWTQSQVDGAWDIVGLKNGQTKADVASSGFTGAPVVTSARAVDALTGAGTYAGEVTATVGTFAAAVGSNYSFDPYFFDPSSSIPAADLIVDKAAVTVGVLGTPLSKVYGAVLPTLTPEYTGLKNGQTSATAGLVGAPVLATTATQSSGVGAYTVTVDVTGLSADNYTFTGANGTLNITKAPLTVAADPKTREYGLSNPTLTATLTGFVLGQTLATSGVTGSASLSTTALATSGIGDYPITVAVGTLASANYSFTTFTDSILTITRAPLTARADNQTKVYGDANPALTFSWVGLRQGDTASVVNGGTPTLSTTVTNLTGAGTYAGAITADITGLTADNYTVGTLPGTFTVQKAQLVGVVDAATRSYGYPNPAFTVTWTGYRNGDTAATSGFTGSLAFSTEANPASPVAGSPYSVSAAVGTYSSPNYSFGAIAPGLLTIERGNLWENEIYNLAAAPLAGALRLEEIQARLRGQPLTQDPQARIDFDKFSIRLLGLPSDAPDKDKDKDKPKA